MLFIPPGEEQLKQNAQKLAELNKGRDNSVKVRAALQSEADRIKAKTKVYDGLIASSRQTTVEIVKELQKTLGDMKRVSSGVDAAAMLAQMGVNLGKLGSIGYKAPPQAEKL